MIHRLTGILIECDFTDVTVDVHGVGYAVTIPMSTYEQLPGMNETVTLHTHLSVREDALKLYGFYSTIERRLFRLLITVSGIGPQLALNALSCMPVQTFCQNVIDGETKALSRINGIGPRAAERLIVELRERVKEYVDSFEGEAEGKEDGSRQLQAEEQDAVAALETLGFKSDKARKAVKKIASDGDGKTAEELIREALKRLNA